MPQDYTQAQLMSDVMDVVATNTPAIVQVALYLAVINFTFNLLFWTLNYLIKKPFRE